MHMSLKEIIKSLFVDILSIKSRKNWVVLENIPFTLKIFSITKLYYFGRKVFFSHKYYKYMKKLLIYKSSF